MSTAVTQFEVRSETGIVVSTASAGHDTGPHPENQSRMDAILESLSGSETLSAIPRYEAPPASDLQIVRAHEARLIERTREIAETGGGYIDADTFVSHGSWPAALAAAGGAVLATHMALDGTHRKTFSLARPPGHHAERTRQMGFCLLNSIAIAALDALEYGQLERVAIVDWDVHHGNGTQDIFYSSPNLLFCSVHQWPWFPGSGLENETGIGPGLGLTVNVPLNAGADQSRYLHVFDQIFEPVIADFQPELLLVSAGFDAHRDDPLGGMDLDEVAFARLTQRVMDWSDRHCGGRLVLVLEGGYNLGALSSSVSHVLRTLDGEQVVDERDHS